MLLKRGGVIKNLGAAARESDDRSFGPRRREESFKVLAALERKTGFHESGKKCHGSVSHFDNSRRTIAPAIL
jgi:hypothetical protein